MDNPYQPPEAPLRRMHRTPLWLAAVMVLLPFAVVGLYVALAVHGGGSWLAALMPLAMPLYLLTVATILGLVAYNYQLQDRFLEKHPVVDGPLALETLKPVVRTNMISALMVFALLILLAASAVLTMFASGWLGNAVVIGLGVVTVAVFRLSNVLEERLRQIGCTDPALEPELSALLRCWVEKVWPDF